MYFFIVKHETGMKTNNKKSKPLEQAHMKYSPGDTTCYAMKPAHISKDRNYIRMLSHHNKLKGP